VLQIDKIKETDVHLKHLQLEAITSTIVGTVRSLDVKSFHRLTCLWNTKIAIALTINVHHDRNQRRDHNNQTATLRSRQYFSTSFLSVSRWM